MEPKEKQLYYFDEIPKTVDGMKEYLRCAKKNITKLRRLEKCCIEIQRRLDEINNNPTPKEMSERYANS